MTMWRAKLSTSTLLLVSTVALILVSTTVLPFAAAVGSGDNDGAQDTMYDLEGSADDMNQGSGGGGSRNGDSSEGSGSGSGRPPVSDCREPPSGTFPEPTDFEDQVLPEIRCHLACVELVGSIVYSSASKLLSNVSRCKFSHFTVYSMLFQYFLT